MFRFEAHKRDKTIEKKCPFHPKRTKKIKWANLTQLEKIDAHLATKKECDYLHPDLKDFVLPGKKAGYTPLVLACEGGDLDAVQHIVERWGADVNKPAVTNFISKYESLVRILYDESKHYARKFYPLFVAAFRGHKYIVRYLIKKGANVSAHSFISNSRGVAALHAAVFYTCRKRDREERMDRRSEFMIRHLVQNGANPSDAVTLGQPMWKWVNDDVPCLMLLIELGMNVRHLDPTDGRTILHYWVSRELDEYSMAIIKLLMKQGVSAKILDKDGLSPLHLAALGDEDEDKSEVMKYLLNHEDFSLEEKICALELAGSWDSQTDDIEMQMQFWRRATRLREFYKIPKTPLIVTPTIKEFTTMAELDAVQHSRYEWRLQCVLVRQRILNRSSSRVFLTHQWPTIKMLFGNREFSVSRFDIGCMILQSICASKTDDLAFTIITDIVGFLSEWLKELENIDSNNPIYGKILTTFDLLAQAVQQHSAHGVNRNVPCYFLDHICKLIDATDGIIPYSDQRVFKCIYALVQLDKRDWSGKTLLHFACDMSPSKSNKVVPVLLLAGADVSATDDSRNSPLHILAQRLNNDSDSATADRLIKAGCHVDWVNSKGKTAADIMKQRFNDFVPNWVKKQYVLPLTCLSAQIASRHLESYDDIPVTLQSFMAMH